MDRSCINRTPQLLIANFDLAATRLIEMIPQLIVQPTEQAVDNVGSCLELLRHVRDSVAESHGILAQTTQDSMELIRADLVERFGEDAVAEGERTGQVPASVVADAILADLD